MLVYLGHSVLTARRPVGRRVLRSWTHSPYRAQARRPNSCTPWFTARVKCMAPRHVLACLAVYRFRDFTARVMEGPRRPNHHHGSQAAACCLEVYRFRDFTARVMGGPRRPNHNIMAPRQPHAAWWFTDGYRALNCCLHSLDLSNGRTDSIV